MYNISCVSDVAVNDTQLHMRLWRNWQTRTVQVRVGNHGGSNPFNRTIKKDNAFRHCLFLILRLKGTAVHVQWGEN